MVRKGSSRTGGVETQKPAKKATARADQVRMCPRDCQSIQMVDGFNKMTVQLDNLVSSVEKLDSRVGRLEEGQARFGATIAALDVKLGNLAARAEENNVEVRKLNNSVINTETSNKFLDRGFVALVGFGISLITALVVLLSQYLLERVSHDSVQHNKPTVNALDHAVASPSIQ